MTLCVEFVKNQFIAVPFSQQKVYLVPLPFPLKAPHYRAEISTSLAFRFRIYVAKWIFPRVCFEMLDLTHICNDFKDILKSR